MQNVMNDFLNEKSIPKFWHASQYKMNGKS